VPEAATQKKPRKPPRHTQHAHKPLNWVTGSRAYLHKLAKKARANGHVGEAYDLLFASRMILDCWNIGEPGLLVGMFYTPDWRSWRDVTAQPKPESPGLPSAQDLDRVEEEERIAIATEKAEAT